MKKQNQNYYDEFSSWYDLERKKGYHALIDNLEIDLITDRCRNKRVLEIGCGTGLLLERARQVAKEVVGIDLSSGMLSKSIERDLPVLQAKAEEIPFKDNTFDVIYCFKVLAHIQEIKETVAEMARVLVPGGYMFLEYYNTKSIRYLVKILGKPGRISHKTTEGAVYTRFDTPERAIGYLPENMMVTRTAGIRVFTPMAGIHKIPVVKTLINAAEWWARDSALKGFGGFFVIEAQKQP